MLLAGALITLAAVVVVIVALNSSTPATPAGCIDVTAASTMGAGTYRACGDAARTRCASRDAAVDAPLARACRRAKLPTASG